MKLPVPGNLYFVGRNYVKHIEELNNERPEQPLIFTKPVSSLMTSPAKVPYPPHTDSLHFEGEMVFSLPGDLADLKNRNSVLVGCGVDWTARDVQSVIKQKGLPWFQAKCFRGAAVVSSEAVAVSLDELAGLRIETWVDGVCRQKGGYAEKLFPLPELIAFLERTIDLDSGDLLYTGTPDGVAPVERESTIEVRLILNDNVLITCGCEVI